MWNMRYAMLIKEFVFFVASTAFYWAGHRNEAEHYLY